MHSQLLRERCLRSYSTPVSRTKTLSALALAVSLAGCVANPTKPADSVVAMPAPDASAPQAESSASVAPDSVAEPSVDAQSKEDPEAVVSVEAAPAVDGVSGDDARPSAVARESDVSTQLSTPAPGSSPQMKPSTERQVVTPAKAQPSQPSTNATPAASPPVAEAALAADKTTAETAPDRVAEEPTVVAMATPVTEVVTDLTMSALPKQYGPWIVEKKSGIGQVNAVISTPTWQMGRGDHSSQIWLTLTPDQLRVNSSSDIDLDTGSTGIKIGGGPLIPFTRLEGQTVAVIEQNLTDQLRQGGKLTIFLGFWPEETPKGKTHQSDISLDKLTAVLPAYLTLVGR